MGSLRVTEAFLGTTEIGEMLDIPPSRVERTMDNHEIPHQTLWYGKREMRVYRRSDVMRFQKNAWKPRARKTTVGA